MTLMPIHVQTVTPEVLRVWRGLLSLPESSTDILKIHIGPPTKGGVTALPVIRVGDSADSIFGLSAVQTPHLDLSGGFNFKYRCLDSRIAGRTLVVTIGAEVDGEFLGLRFEAVFVEDPGNGFLAQIRSLQGFPEPDCLAKFLSSELVTLAIE